MSVGAQTLEGHKFNTGIAHIAIPSDLDRAKYIADCYINCHVCVWTEDGGFLNRVPISQEVLNFIVFPEKPNEVGSIVVYAMDEQYQRPYIISRLLSRDELGDGRENQFKFSRKLDGGFVEISGSAEERTINLLVDGGEQAGTVHINVFSKNADSQLSIDVAGEVIVNAAKAVTLRSHEEIRIETIEDENESSRIEQSSTEQKFYTKKWTLNDGDEPMVLGNKLEKILDDLISAVSGLTIQGKPIDPPHKIKLEALKGKLKTMLSKEALLNK